MPIAPENSGTYILNKTDDNVSWLLINTTEFATTGQITSLTMSAEQLSAAIDDVLNIETLSSKFVGSGSVTISADNDKIIISGAETGGDLPENVMLSADEMSAGQWIWDNGKFIEGPSYYANYKTYVNDPDATIEVPLSGIYFALHNNNTSTNYNYIKTYAYNNSHSLTTGFAYTLPNHWSRMFSAVSNNITVTPITNNSRAIWQLSAKDFTETFTAVSANTAYFTGNGTTDSALSLTDDVTAKLSKVPDATPFELSAGNYIKITPDTTNNIVTIAVDGTIDTFTGISANTAYFTGNGKDEALSVNTAWSNLLATSAGVTDADTLWALTTTGWTTFTAGGEKGDPGFSPTVTITDITDATPSGVNVEFTYQNDQGKTATTAYSLYAGEKGEKGFSPTVATTAITDDDNNKTGTEITFTYLDEEGITTTTAYSAWNGKDGEGAPPSFTATATTEWNGVNNTFSYIKMKIENSDEHDDWASDNTLHFVLQQS